MLRIDLAGPSRAANHPEKPRRDPTWYRRFDDSDL